MVFFFKKKWLSSSSIANMQVEQHIMDNEMASVVPVTSRFVWCFLSDSSPRGRVPPSTLAISCLIFKQFRRENSQCESLNYANDPTALLYSVCYNVNKRFLMRWFSTSSIVLSNYWLSNCFLNMVKSYLYSMADQWPREERNLNVILLDAFQKFKFFLLWIFHLFTLNFLSTDTIWTQIQLYSNHYKSTK